jgi:hypothetical protein
MQHTVTLEFAKALEIAGIKPNGVSAGQIYLTLFGGTYIVLKNHGIEEGKTQNSYDVAAINPSGSARVVKVNEDEFEMMFWAPSAIEIMEIMAANRVYPSLQIYTSSGGRIGWAASIDNNGNAVMGESPANALAVALLSQKD